MSWLGSGWPSQLCVHYPHDEKIRHRNIKPANILTEAAPRSWIFAISPEYNDTGMIIISCAPVPMLVNYFFRVVQWIRNISAAYLTRLRLLGNNYSTEKQAAERGKSILRRVRNDRSAETDQTLGHQGMARKMQKAQVFCLIISIWPESRS